MYRLLDLHVHPTLKMYYVPWLSANFHTPLYRYSGKHWNPLSFRTQYANLNAGPVKAMMVSHYVIERGFISDGFRWFGEAVSWAFGASFYGKLRFADPFKTVNKQMDVLEKAVERTNRFIPNGGKRMKMVYHPAEMDAVADDEIAMIHTIEGSHALGYKPEKGQSKEEFWYIARQRLHYLKDRGLAMMTLAHFWDNMFSPQTDGTEWIPKAKGDRLDVGRDDWLFHMKRATWRWGDPEYLSRELTTEMLKLGILIDLSHTQEHGRKRIYELCQDHNRPVIASHVGLQHFFNHEYNLADDEVRAIHKLGGVCGLILSNRLLVDPIRRYRDTGEGIGHFVENAKHIADLTGDVSCIGVGTDLDGLTHPFTDCHTPAFLDRIGDALSKEFSPDEVDAIFYGNSLRALKAGWDGSQSRQSGQKKSA